MGLDIGPDVRAMNTLSITRPGLPFARGPAPVAPESLATTGAVPSG
jgi:hypothetical protein